MYECINYVIITWIDILSKEIYINTIKKKIIIIITHIYMIHGYMQTERRLMSSKMCMQTRVGKLSSQSQHESSGKISIDTICLHALMK